MSWKESKTKRQSTSYFKQWLINKLWAVSVNSVRRSRPECSPSQPSETRLQSAIDFSSWIVTNYLRAGVIAEQGCKVCIKLLLFVLSSSQFTVLGRMFVSLSTVETDPPTHPVFAGIFRSIIKVEDQDTPWLNPDTRKDGYDESWHLFMLQLYISLCQIVYISYTYFLAITLCWWCFENTKHWHERLETSRCLIKNASILGNKHVPSSPERYPVVWCFYRHTNDFLKKDIEKKLTPNTLFWWLVCIAIPWTFVSREALIKSGIQQFSPSFAMTK